MGISQKFWIFENFEKKWEFSKKFQKRNFQKSSKKGIFPPKFSKLLLVNFHPESGLDRPVKLKIILFFRPLISRKKRHKKRNKNSRIIKKKNWKNYFFCWKFWRKWCLSTFDLITKITTSSKKFQQKIVIFKKFSSSKFSSFFNTLRTRKKSENHTTFHINNYFFVNFKQFFDPKFSENFLETFSFSSKNSRKIGIFQHKNLEIFWKPVGIS